MQELTVPWQCARATVYDIFCDKRPISPQHIDAAAKFPCLDEFDTNELRLRGTTEAGWSIDITFLQEQKSWAPRRPSPPPRPFAT